jgi:hypothetical protein
MLSLTSSGAAPARRSLGQAVRARRVSRRNHDMDLDIAAHRSEAHLSGGHVTGPPLHKA